ncbi:MAG: hypothetical protein IPP48_03215 [Chitinophagaceae bacterium]|nr:hypothetical protein [Chitinophagaceae bacterium]
MQQQISNKTQAQRKKLIYIAHPIKGNIEENLAKIRKIVKSIYSSPKYATVVPLVPYYLDVLLLNDEIPEQRQRGLNNGLALLAKNSQINELWLCGDVISDGMKAEVFAAFESKIKVCAFNGLFNELKQLEEEWEKRLD